MLVTPEAARDSNSPAAGEVEKIPCFLGGIREASDPPAKKMPVELCSGCLLARPSGPGVLFGSLPGLGMITPATRGSCFPVGKVGQGGAVGRSVNNFWRDFMISHLKWVPATCFSNPPYRHLQPP